MTDPYQQEQCERCKGYYYWADLVINPADEDTSVCKDCAEDIMREEE